MPSSADSSHFLYHLGCWDHVRRRFIDAEKALMTNRAAGRVSKASEALVQIRALYRIEREIKAAWRRGKRHQRRVRSRPVLDTFVKYKTEG